MGIPLFVELDGPEGPRARLITDVREIEWSDETLVSTDASRRFVPLREALTQSPDVTSALLELSPDPDLDRWKRYRPVAIAAPVSFGVLVTSELLQVNELAADARKVTGSPAFRAAELDPETRQSTRERHERIERAVTMRYAYVGLQGAMCLVALWVVLSGFRRLRALPLALGLGAAAWWLYHAGQPGRCFGTGALRQWILALLGLAGGLGALLLAPSELRLTAALRQRLGLPAPSSPTLGQGHSMESKREARWGRLRAGDVDVLAALAAVWAGLALPFVLNVLGTWGWPTTLRAAVFVSFCSLCFMVGLAIRPDLTRTLPRAKWVALAAVLGFGVTAAADLGARATFGTMVEVRACLSPGQNNPLRNMQESSTRETSAARRETQTQWLAFLVAVGIAPISEEMLYRGTLQRIARRRIGARWAMLVSAAVFGLAHAIAFPAAFYQHFGLGFAFAATFELAGAGPVALLASAATHTAWNAWLALLPVF